MRHTFVRAAAALTGATFALALTANAPAQDAGVKQVEQLVKKAEATVAAIGETKLQLTKTMDVYNTLLPIPRPTARISTRSSRRRWRAQRRSGQRSR